MAALQSADPDMVRLLITRGAIWTAQLVPIVNCSVADANAVAADALLGMLHVLVDGDGLLPLAFGAMTQACRDVLVDRIGELSQHTDKPSFWESHGMVREVAVLIGSRTGIWPWPADTDPRLRFSRRCARAPPCIRWWM